jgi:hypothetical protein
VEEGADEEHNSRGPGLGVAHLDQGNVQMAHAPPMNWHVPGPPEHFDVIRVPPLVVEAPIGKMEHLTDQVQERMEEQVEAAHPDQVIWNLKKLFNIFNNFFGLNFDPALINS